MAPSQLSRLLRRAVLLHLSLVSPGLVGCGGQTAPSLFGDKTSADAGDDSPDAESNTACSVIPNSGFDSSGTCDGWVWRFNGTPDQCGQGDAGGLPLAQCERLCPAIPQGDPGAGLPTTACSIADCFDCFAGPSSGEILSCTYGTCGGTGRRPAGLRPTRRRNARRTVPGALAEMAYLEAASVPAFERLARELTAHGAPKRLRQAAIRAMQDEKRHTRVMRALAEKAGASPTVPRVSRGRVRSLEAVARENAVEGCVYETFGAAIALAQSVTARDPTVRAVMSRIALDEMRHAELAWRVAQWAEVRLTPAARVRVDNARRRAASRLVKVAGRDVDPCLVAELGVPARAQARGIALDVARALCA